MFDSYLDAGFDDMKFNIACDVPVPVDQMGYRRLGCEIILQWWRDLQTNSNERDKCLAWIKTETCRRICELAGIEVNTLELAVNMWKEGKL